MTPLQLQQAFAAFDNANAQDPHKEIFEGKEYSRELLYAQRMTDWVKKLDPNASEVLLLAARCQHLCRWMIPRRDYGPGRIEYLKWRKRLYQFHAEKAGEILKKVGYPEEIIQKVQAINLKKDLKDPDTQTVEDALCLVFLEFQLRDYLKKIATEKWPGIIQKTWGKMSGQAREFALKLKFSEEELKMIQNSLA